VALDLATPGDTVLVAPGRYVETLILKHGVDVRGAGADRTLLDLGDQLPSLRCANATLDGLFVWRDVRSARNPTEAVDCTNATSPTISASRIGAAGVAIRLEGSRAIVTGSEVDGAIVGLDASPVIEESELDGRGGSALRLSYSMPGAEAVRIERNRIRGALELEGFAPEASRVVGNLFLPTPQLGIPPRAWGGLSASAVGDLGLIASNTFLGTQGIAFCEFFSPLPPWTGPLPLPGGPCVSREQGATAIIANNVLAFGSRGILLDAASDPSIVHNDVFQNENPFALAPTGNYVGVTNLTGIDGNLSEDPLFEDHEDAVPGAGSPLLDAGTEELAASALDLDGDPRVAAEAIDLGAQERQPGEPAVRPVQIFVEGRARTSGFGLGSVLVPKKSFRVSIRPDPDLDAPAEVDIDSLSLEGFAPLRRCRARDADGDGAEDLVCRFSFEAFEGASGLVTKRVCLLGQTTDGSALRGCTRTHVLRLPHATVR